MNWIILIVAGLFEVAFAASHGKAKETTGTEATFWRLFFISTLIVSIVGLKLVSSESRLFGK